MEQIVEQTLLYDFYGELLTEHQKLIYEEVILNDYSLSEVANEHGISRQSVHDMMKRSSKILNDYEEKLHLVEKFLAVQEMAEQIRTKAAEFFDDRKDCHIYEIQEISRKIIEEM